MSELPKIIFANLLSLSLLSLGVAGVVAERQARKNGDSPPAAAPSGYDPVFIAACLGFVIGHAIVVAGVLFHPDIFGWLIVLFVPELWVCSLVLPHSLLSQPLQGLMAQTILVIGMDITVAWLLAHPIASAARLHRAKAARLGFGFVFAEFFAMLSFTGNRLVLVFLVFVHLFLRWFAKPFIINGQPIPNGTVLGEAVALSVVAGYVFRIWYTKRRKD